jgi:hypothetical protein
MYNLILLLIEVPYAEDNVETILNQFRYSNTSVQPYHHPVCAWERGFVCKHMLMSL